VEHDLSRNLHVLTARLDRAADRLLRSDAGLSYARFLALYMVGAWEADTQRALAARLGVTEPSVSRMIHALVASGLLEAAGDPAGGNRRRLRLTAAGSDLVARWGSELELRLAALVGECGLSYQSYAENTQRLVAAVQGDMAPEGRSVVESAMRSPSPIGRRDK
jgi:DNA-binding MarR family transcriptional regulator